MHAMTHVALLAAGFAFLWWRTRDRMQMEMPRSSDVDRQLTNLQQSLDVIAQEVSRVEAAQREAAKLADRERDR